MEYGSVRLFPNCPGDPSAHGLFQRCMHLPGSPSFPYSSHVNPAKAREVWHRRALAVARQCNVGWWLDRFYSIFLAGLSILSIAILCLRWMGSLEMDLYWVGGTVVSWILISAVIAWHLAKKRFVNIDVGILRLDESLVLGGRLVSAAAGVGTWPAPDRERMDFDQATAAFRWNWPRVIGPVGIAIALLGIALWIPVGHSENVPKGRGTPAAWDQMEDWLARLEEEKVADKDSLEEMGKMLKALTEQSEKDWFSHSSLEATDRLRDTLSREMEDLSSAMSEMERNLSALQNSAAMANDVAKSEAVDGFQKALERMEGNALGASQELKDQLKKLGSDQLKSLSPEDIAARGGEALQQELQKGMSTLGSMSGLPELTEASGQGGQMGGQGEGEMDGRSEDESPGTGGVSRGPGAAPLTFGEEQTPLGTGSTSAIESQDLSRAVLGDGLGESGRSEPDVEKVVISPTAGGSVQVSGTGGQAIQKEALLPEEQALLKRYFK